MKLENETARLEMKKRLRRLEGQVRGIETMLDDNRDCREIVQQMLSIRAAAQSATMYYIREYMDSCLTANDQPGTESARDMMDDIVTMLAKVS